MKAMAIALAAWLVLGNWARAGALEIAVLTAAEMPAEERGVVDGFVAGLGAVLGAGAQIAHVAGRGAPTTAAVTVDLGVAVEYQLRIRLIDVAGGRVRTVQGQKGGRDEVFGLVEQAGEGVLAALRERGAPLKVAVMPFQCEAGARFAPFASGLSDMVANALAQQGSFTVLHQNYIEEGQRRLAEQGVEGRAELGQWLGADVVVTGVFSEQYQVQARLRDSGAGQELGSHAVRGTERDIDRKVTELAKRLAGEYRVLSGMVRKVAVLDFENYAPGEHRDFVRGLADMLMTSLAQSEDLRVVERVQIDKALENFKVELSGPIDEAQAVEIGQWLGADAVVLGSFARFGEAYRIDGRLIDAGTGELLVARHVQGAEGQVMGLVEELGRRLVAGFVERRVEVAAEQGAVEVRFMIARTEMTERPVYYHICKAYIDGRLAATTEPVEAVEQWQTLLVRELDAGLHRVELVHGYVRDGKWDGEMPQQPKAFDVHIEAGTTTTVQYAYEVGWFADSYRYKHPWRGAPR